MWYLDQKHLSSINIHNKMSLNFSHNGHSMNRDWLLLNNQFAMDVFYNKKIINNTGRYKFHVVTYWNTVTRKVHHIGDLKNMVAYGSIKTASWTYSCCIK